MGERATQALGDEIDRLIDHFRMEWDITYAEVVGTLMMKAHTMMAEAEDRADEAETGGEA